MSKAINPRFAMIPAVVLERVSTLSGSAVKLAVALSGFVNAKTGTAWPSNTTLMAAMGTARWQTFRDARAELAASCGLTWTAGGGGRRKAVYTWKAGESTQSVESTPRESTESVESQGGGESTESVCRESTESVRIKHKNEHSTTETPIPTELRDLELYRGDAKLLRNWGSLRKAWKAAYPALNVVEELRKAHAWEVSNPANRKKDHARFLNAWLSRAKPVASDDDDYQLSAEQMAFARSRLAELAEGKRNGK